MAKEEMILLFHSKNKDGIEINLNKYNLFKDSIIELFLFESEIPVDKISKKIGQKLFNKLGD
ncbi:MAG: hypothetical protein V3V00_02370 [Saprospiraceae bacterium]